MKDLAAFKACFGARFWKKVNESLIPFKERTEDRPRFLENLYNSLLKREYEPSLPREYIINNKYNLVSRIVPAFSQKDYCVYFYCLKALEEFIADPEGRIPGTFGAWRLNSGLSEAEDQEVLRREEEILSDILSAPDTSYNPLAWRKHWQEFQQRAYEFGQSRDSNFIIKCDIANFYDCINLNLLEDRVRIATGNSECEDEISLLFYFLRHWNKKFENYHSKCVGLPQDEVGDCSRILANFYLRSYDKTMHQLCEAKGVRYLRYSDDQLFFASDKESARFVIFEASKELHKLGLNLNASKVCEFDTKEKFNLYWAFDIFNLINDENKENTRSIEEALNNYFSRDKKEFRYDSVLGRLLVCKLTDVSPALKHRLLAELLIPEYLARCSSSLLKKIYNAFPEQRNDFFRVLDQLINQVRYNSFHYNLKKFYKTNRPDFDQSILDRKILEIQV